MENIPRSPDHPPPLSSKMYRFFQVATFLLALLLATTHGRNIPNSLNNDVLKLNSDSPTAFTTTGSIERRDWTFKIWGTGCSEYSSTASIEPRALYVSETPSFADGFPTTTITDAMATPLVARDETVTEGSDVLYIPNPRTVGLVVVATMSVGAGSSPTNNPDSKGHGKVYPKYCGDSTIFAHLGLC
ncbi:uncharacterized protein Bfra_005344 [Botrytis fragariae]|uniref:Uncharacterized protein n=1 Tax=Botrytis fragariae TaxID=1964551 RepID=A0A8H6AUI3_9HELO|nr:uncharacterized protein Bfra_005344 [Botrytis fragariae]KAF5873877.1 hypothetical protein Bfra_005344 [Botrytis fragariae]